MDETVLVSLVAALLYRRYNDAEQDADEAIYRATVLVSKVMLLDENNERSTSGTN